jgi:hypothetical protein
LISEVFPAPDGESKRTSRRSTQVKRLRRWFVSVSRPQKSPACWQPASSNYWRSYAQSSLLYTAEKLPPKLAMLRVTETLVKSSLSIHLEGVSTDEMARAAVILHRIGRSSEAAVVWLGLTNAHSIKGDNAAAQAFAKRSFQAAPNLDALVALIVFTRDDPTEQSRWVQQIQFDFPRHGLAVAWACLDSVRSFQVDPPANCDGADWVRSTA